ncbi:MAG: inositol monophosphatase family protein [Acidimicrobiales bacterium]
MDAAAVSEAIMAAAASEVLPRFGALSATDVTEKTPGEVVTEADRACERALTASLRRIRDIPVVGEEAAAAAAKPLTDLRTAGAVWLVDPLDGTSNFVAGSTDYSVMVALVEEGSTIASWMWHPATEVMAHAVSCAGAWFNGERVFGRPPVQNLASLRGVLKKRFLPDGVRERVDEDRGVLAAASEGRNCAGLDYPDLVRGAVDFLLYWRTLPWDHAPGVLFAQEAGFHAGRLDGSEYHPGDDAVGLLISHRQVWAEVRDALLGDMS